MNVLTCVGDDPQIGFSPGQLTFDSATSTLYAENIGRTTLGIHRSAIKHERTDEIKKSGVELSTVVRCLKPGSRAKWSSSGSLSQRR
jgi:hypothetical protein